MQCSGDGGDMSPCLLGEEESRARRASLSLKGPIANAGLIGQYLFFKKMPSTHLVSNYKSF